MSNQYWIKKPDSIILGQAPYPSATIRCTRCERSWADTEDPTCQCDDEDFELPDDVEDHQL